MEKEEIRKLLEERIEGTKNKLKKVRQSLRQFDKGKWFFRVDLESRWNDYGEKGFGCEGEPGESLEDVIQKAEEGFKKQNKRSDVQAWRMYSVVFENRDFVVIEYPS